MTSYIIDVINIIRIICTRITWHAIKPRHSAGLKICEQSPGYWQTMCPEKSKPVHGCHFAYRIQRDQMTPNEDATQSATT